MACTRVQKTWWYLPSGEKTWQEVVALTRWFKENWVDVKTGKPCGRQKGEKRGYPACRPKNRVSSKTPKTVGEMSAAEKARFKREKTSSKKITYQHRRKKRKKRKKWLNLMQWQDVKVTSQVSKKVRKRKLRQKKKKK